MRNFCLPAVWSTTVVTSWKEADALMTLRRVIHFEKPPKANKHQTIRGLSITWTMSSSLRLRKASHCYYFSSEGKSLPHANISNRGPKSCRMKSFIQSPGFTFKELLYLTWAFGSLGWEIRLVSSRLKFFFCMKFPVCVTSLPLLINKKPHQHTQKGEFPYNSQSFWAR